MFGRLLTPLVTPLVNRFDLSPRPDAKSENVEQDEDASAENFARDVMIEVMRNSVVSLKEAENLKDKIEVMGEMHRIMLEEVCTKDVFRELDGYLLIVNVLTMLYPVIENDSANSMQVEECERLAFMIFTESLIGHPTNNRYFEKQVGYVSLRDALIPLLVDSNACDQVFGFLLSASQNNFALASIFSMLRLRDSTDFSDQRAILGTMKNANCFGLIVSLLSNIPAGDSFLPRAVYALTEVLVTASHRNKALMSNTRLFREFLDGFFLRGAPVLKLLKKLLDVGAETEDVRYLFNQSIQKDGSLHADLLETIRSGMKFKWPMHFSMENPAALRFQDKYIKGLPPSGFTFMIWVYVERLPRSGTQSMFKIETVSRALLQLSLRSDGTFELSSSESSGVSILERAKIARARWTHVALVHRPHRASNPNIRVFIDGTLIESRQWSYPRTDLMVSYNVGCSDCSPPLVMSWSFASSYLLSVPLADDVPRIIQHLGPRYSGHFQTTNLYRLLTYEASTSLNIFFSSFLGQRIGASQTYKASSNMPSSGSVALRFLLDGIGLSEESFIFSIFPSGYRCNEDEGGKVTMYVRNGMSSPKGHTNWDRIEIIGDVVPVTRDSLDISLWKIGGCAIALRFVELASTSHELSRALGIFTDSSRASWQMCEDMEHLAAFETLVHVLRTKAQLINLTAFETLFEFLGLNFRNPDRSVVVNAIAYRTIALDFGLWASTKTDIQRMHLEHFSTLLESSKHRMFNAKQRISKFGVIRKMLFVLQTNWYTTEMVVQLVCALKCVAQSCFSADDTIKPIISFLVANLYEDNSQVPSPGSIVSHIDRANIYNKAEEVLVAFVSVLSSTTHFLRFSSALPVPRICLLLLGDSPSSTVAIQVLTIIRLAFRTSSSFIRRFELVSGWTALKATLPKIWDDQIQEITFRILFGNFDESTDVQSDQHKLKVFCPNIIPTILAAFEQGLSTVAQDSFDEEAMIAESYVESLLEQMINSQSTSPSFCQLFKSQQTTAMLIGAYSTFVAKGASIRVNWRTYTRILEKLNHFVMGLTLDHVLSNSQKQELLTIFRKAETLLTSEFTDDLPPVVEEHDGSPTRRLRVTHINVHSLSEKAYLKTMVKIRDWRRGIAANERKRLRRVATDLREYRRHAEQNIEWRNALYDERGLWPAEETLQSWILDDTEGPCRVRKKLQRKLESLSSFIHDGQTRAVTEPDDAQSFVQVDSVVPPWAEEYELQLNGDLEEQWMDEFSDDKLRRIRHELSDGDCIEDVCSVTRIVGVDSSPGLLLLGHTHLYMLDGFAENDDGEIVEACQAPKNLFTVPGSVLEVDGKQRAQKWTYDQVISLSRKTCLFRDVALELYTKDNRSLLLVFPNKKRRQAICDKLNASVSARSVPASRSPLVFNRSPLLGRTAPKILSDLRDELATAQRRWQAREISNFTYISILNQTSGRTPCDATQYPVFPWVLADYSSEALDLSSPATFRDLSRPMGALSEDRREAARQRYENLKSVGETPFHYGTHFSSSMIVCHFLIRLEPFTHMFKKLQGGDWDLPDRLFVDVGRAYYSASQDMRGDVRELIPEFFTCPEFLQNLGNVDFGVQQNTGERIHDVKLPPWAKGDPLLFITEHRKALESDFVSENLPAWIDLIWGCKQRDADSLNVFHPYSYEGAIDLDKITDDLEREATVGIIHNFGQTPRKLFNAPHPARLMQGPTTLPLGTSYGVIEDVHLLVQSPRAIDEISNPVASLSIDMISERIVPCPPNVSCVPSFPHEEVAWGFIDQSIKLIVDAKVVHVSEAVSCTCVSFVDSNRFISGSSDYAVRFWDLERRDGRTSLSRTNLLRAHTGEVLCVAASRAWSCGVSGSKDGTVIIWDLNRAAYVRTINHGAEGPSGVHILSINESTGCIASCSERKLCLHTINACRIAELDLTATNPSDGRITSIAFHEREYSRLGMLASGTDAGYIVLRSWTAADTPAGEKAQWNFVTLRKLRCREGYDGKRSDVTAVEFVGETLYHGDGSGKVFSWDLPD